MARRPEKTGRKRSLLILVLAAGQGKRMRSSRIKLLHDVAGRPMVDYVLDAARRLAARRRVVVLGNQAESVRERVPDGTFDVVLQREQLGTGHAVMQAGRPLGRENGELLVLNGDLPGILPSTLRRFVEGHRRHGAAASVLTAVVEDPSGYGRVVRDAAGRFVRIVEHADASPAERRIREINTGVYCFRCPLVFRTLRRLRAENRQREYYLPDVLAMLRERGDTVRAVAHPDAWEVLGVNSRAELAAASRRIHERRVRALMEGGVTVQDPASVWVGPDVRVGRDALIHPNVHLEGRTTIGKATQVLTGCVIRDCRIGNGVTIQPYSVMAESVVGDGARVGPFAHIRAGSDLARGVHIGNFVEIKKSRIGDGSKANHLTYLGDALVGRGVNIGAGTITCNYDGVKKGVTVIEDGAFIGSDSQLIAPVTIGRGAYIGSGSTIRRPVPPGALAVTGGEQRNIEGWVERKKKRGG